MRRAACAVAVLSTAAVLGGAACSSSEPSSPARALDLPALGVSIPAVPGAGDLVAADSTGPEGQPAAALSSDSLVRAGGGTCRAGAQGAVSPYPLGQVVVLDESPEQIREEFAEEGQTGEDPEDSPGEPLRQIGDRWLYYRAPPQEPCSERPEARRLQADQLKAVQTALSRATALPQG